MLMLKETGLGLKLTGYLTVDFKMPGIVDPITEHIASGKLLLQLPSIA